ncbi:MAG TPA: PIN domain-containing protein, partial [Isosphaeraceae bacterium]
IFIDDALAACDEVVFSAITLVEVVYLAERGRIAADSLNQIRLASQAEPLIREWPILGSLADFVARIPRVEIPELPDRVIAATALRLGVPLLTADRVIRASSVPTVW